jgi:glutaredoxin-related protein
MNLVLYIAENCHDCAEVLSACERLGFDFPVLNYDLDDVTDAPLNLYAFPALCDGDRVLAYGIDVISYLELPSQ